MTKKMMLPMHCEAHQHAGFGPSSEYPCPWCEIERLTAEVASLRGQSEPRDRLMEALRTIRFAGRNEHPTSVWMQKVAARAMEPDKWPEQSAEPPIVEPTEEVPWMLRQPPLSEIQEVRNHLETVPTQALSGVDAEAIEHTIELLQRIENTAKPAREHAVFSDSGEVFRVQFQEVTYALVADQAAFKNWCDGFLRPDLLDGKSIAVKLHANRGAKHG